MNETRSTMSRLRLGLVLAVAVAALAAAGSATAFDCIRVSSSLQGLRESTQSGKWALFDLSSGASVQQSFAAVGDELTSAQAACLAAEYAASGQPLYFALGFGVAGRNGELAHNNPNEGVLSDGRGVDHIDDSPILPAIFAAAGACGIPVE